MRRISRIQNGAVDDGCILLTHSIDLMRDKYVTGPVVLGAYAGVMSGCMLLSGTRVPARSIVSAGSVVTAKLTQELHPLPGQPGRTGPPAFREFALPAPGRAGDAPT